MTAMLVCSTMTEIAERENYAEPNGMQIVQKAALKVTFGGKKNMLMHVAVDRVNSAPQEQMYAIAMNPTLQNESIL